MKESRRGLFRLFGALAATPVVKALPEIPEAKAAPPPVAPWRCKNCGAGESCDCCYQCDGAGCDYCDDTGRITDFECSAG